MAGRSRPNRLAAKSLPAKTASLRTQQGRGLDKRQARRPQQRPRRHRSWLKWLRDFVIGLAICAALVGWWIGQRHPEPPQPNNPADLRDLAATLPPPLQSLADDHPPSPPPPSSVSQPHFPIQDIVVTGTHYLGQAEVVANLPFERGDALGRINLPLAANKIKQLPWVRQVHLRRDWVRQQVVVDIQEWQPVALLQQQGRVKLMNAEGMVLNAPLTLAFQQFILLVGNGASKQWSQLDHLLASQPMLRERIKTASWVGNRRWDLQLDNGVTIKLPELDPTAALAKFVSLDKRGQDSP
ncbi:MAG: cell division protein FtsQ/DivIB, partial [Holosporaceae bacterium]